ncbi:MAG: VWA domain-containing protein [Candidatus Aminicenantes bacterium]|nr:VWA domain-containing protein [Candidatus Aminicenantes bacterium]
MFLILGTFAWPQAASRQHETLRFRAEADIVLVDLVATDRKGRFVSDLRQDEIEVFEDGNRRKIQFFRLEQFETPGEEQGEPSAQMVRGRGHVPQGRQGGYVVFLLDLQTMDLNSAERSKEAVREFLRSELDPGDLAMLVTIRPAFHVDQPFTRDPEKLERALDRVPYRREQVSLEEFAERVDEIFNRFKEAPLSYAVMEAQQYLSNLRTRLDLSCRAISALSRYLGSLPGRKRVIYFSRGYAINARLRVSEIIERRMAQLHRGMYGPRAPTLTTLSKLRIGNMASIYARSLRSAVDQANRNQVSVYSIDPRGLMLVPFQLGTFYDIGDVEAPQEFLATLSEDTGGLLFTNENELVSPIRTAYLDSRSYYLLGYVPDAKFEEGKFHRIEVNVKRKGLKLRYRRGYESLAPERAAQFNLANAFKFPDLYLDFPFRLSVRRQGKQWVVRPLIPNQALSFSTDGDRKRCQIEIFGMPFDASGEPLGEGFLFVKMVDMDFSEQELVRFRQFETFGPSLETEMPEDSRDLVVVLRQSLSGALSAGTHRIGGNATPD